MKKVNIDKQLCKMYDSKILGYKHHYTDGFLIKEVNMSKYLKECYSRSIELDCVINANLEYKYYFDKRNEACVLFTEPLIEDYSNLEEVTDKKDALIIEIYGTPDYFMQSTLHAYYHHQFVVPSESKWEKVGMFYKTDCKEYNALSIVKDMEQLLDPIAMRRKDTIDSIIND